jgi:hypothetical protein
MSFQIESKQKEVNKRPEHIYNFLSNFHHFKGLLPEDKIENWTCTETSCSFVYAGITEMSILIKKTDEPGMIHYHSAHDAKFPFDLFVYIEPKGEISNCKAVLDVHMSKTIKIIAQKPLEKFADSIIDKLEETNF